MKVKSWKLTCSLLTILSAGAVFAGCQTSETVTVAAGPGGSALIVEECDSTSACPAAQKAKTAMQPGKTECSDKANCDTSTKTTKPETVEVSRKHTWPLEKFEAEAGKLATTLAHAFKNGDAKAFIAALPENLRKDFDEKKFMSAHKMMTEAMGEIVSADFVTNLKHPLLSIQVWKIGFKKTGKDSGEFIQQALFQVTIGEVDKKAQVVSFGFI